METIEVYVRGDAHTPSRFWDYALLTNGDTKKYNDYGFHFCQKNTDLYKSLTEEERKRVSFLYVNGVKQV